MCISYTAWVAMDPERERAEDAAYRKRSANKVVRSDANGLSDGELLAKLGSFGIEMDRSHAGAALHSETQLDPGQGL